MIMMVKNDMKVRDSDMFLIIFIPLLSRSSLANGRIVHSRGPSKSLPTHHPQVSSSHSMLKFGKQNASVVK